MTLPGASSVRHAHTPDDILPVLVQQLVERLDEASPADDDGQHGDSRFHKRILLCQNKIIPSAVQQKGWKQQMTTQQGCAFVFPLLVARNASSLSER